jgi:hypothetical protein
MLSVNILNVLYNVIFEDSFFYLESFKLLSKIVGSIKCNFFESLTYPRYLKITKMM